MIPELDRSGNLPAGIHLATWQEVVARFGFSARRQELLSGLHRALTALKAAGCTAVYLDGSFVTAKRHPGDYDACWDINGVDVEKLDAVFLDFAQGRAAQKRKYLGEFFPAQMPEGVSGKLFLDFFQLAKETGLSKGMIQFNLRDFEP